MIFILPKEHWAVFEFSIWRKEEQHRGGKTQELNWRAARTRVPISVPAKCLFPLDSRKKNSQLFPSVSGPLFCRTCNQKIRWLRTLMTLMTTESSGFEADFDTKSRAVLQDLKELFSGTCQLDSCDITCENRVGQTCSFYRWWTSSPWSSASCSSSHPWRLKWPFLTQFLSHHPDFSFAIQMEGKAK